MSISEAIASCARFVQAVRSTAEDNKAVAVLGLAAVAAWAIDRAARAGSFTAAEAGDLPVAPGGRRYVGHLPFILAVRAHASTHIALEELSRYGIVRSTQTCGIPADMQADMEQAAAARGDSARTDAPGRLVLLHLPLGRRAVTISDAATALHVLSSNIQDAHADFGVNGSSRRAFGSAVPRGMLILEGDEHRVHRKSVARAFAPQPLRRAAATVQRAIDAMLCDKAGFHVLEDGQLDGRQTNLTEWFNNLALYVIGVEAFAHEFPIVDDEAQAGEDADGGHARQLRDDVQLIMQGIVYRFSLPPFLWRFMLPDVKPYAEAKRRVADVLNNVIESSLARDVERTETTNNVLTMLVADGRLDEKSIRDEAMMFFLAGHETSYKAMTWLIIDLLQNPDVMARVQTEIDAAAGDISLCPYLTAVVKESMRLHPVAPLISRACKRRGVRIDGLDVSLGPKDGMLINTWAIHRSDLYWKDPLTFNPERFLGENEAKIVPGSFLPFGHGPKACIGYKFAMNEILIAATRLLGDYVLDGDVSDMKPELRFTLAPSKPLMVNIRRRKQ